MKTIVNHGSRKIEVTIVKGKSITLNTNDGEIINVFKIGDTCETDSYNLSYFGGIVQITEKNVICKERWSSKKKHLKIDTFAWRNYNFDVKEKSEENAVTSMYI